MTVYGADEEGNIVVLFDSRWRFPEDMGFRPDDPIYADLQKAWEAYTGHKIPKNEKGSVTP